MSIKLSLHHIGLVARNFDVMANWYQQVLGFELIKQWEMPEIQPGVRMAFLKYGSFILELLGDGEKLGHRVALDPLEDYQITGYRHIAFAVDDVDRLIAGLEAKGASIFFPPYTFDVPNIRASLVRDPEGNTIEFMKRL